MRSGVLGGTFDPPHLAHLALAAAARHALALDRVVFVPAGQPWRKADRLVTDAALRLRMLRAALEPLSWAEISAVEMVRGGPSYSAQTLAGLASEGGEWWFVLGADALAELPHWHDPRGLVAVARLALASRGPDGLEVPPAVLRAVRGIEQRIDHVPLPPLDISSTDLRARVREGRPTDVLLPEGVRRIVDEARLYRGG